MTTCCICGIDEGKHETPADPPFFPAEGGLHCDGCEFWLQTGEFVTPPEKEDARSKVARGVWDHYRDLGHEDMEIVKVEEVEA